MDSLKEFLENRKIKISLRYFGAQDLSTGWEAKTIVENQDIFDDLYSRFPLTEILSLDDYYLYLLSLKLASMKEIAPVQVEDEHKAFIIKLSECAENATADIKNRDVIKFINQNIRDVFDKEKMSYDMRDVSLDIIAKYNGGIDKKVFEFLCKDSGFLLIDRFEQFEKTFEKYPDIFELIYPSGHLEEIHPFYLEKTLDIWHYILGKKKSSLKEKIVKYVAVLVEDIKKNG